MCWDTPVNFGRYRDKTYVWVLINKPDYVRWLYAQTHDSENIYLAQGTLDILIGYLDEHPFLQCCAVCRSSPTTYATWYRDTPFLMFWCASCNPLSLGAEEQKLHRIETYRDALNWVRHNNQLEAVVRALVAAKLPVMHRDRLTSKRYNHLFKYDATLRKTTLDEK